MGRKRIAKSEQRISMWVMVKRKYRKEAEEKLKEIQEFYDRIDYARIENAEEN